MERLVGRRRRYAPRRRGGFSMTVGLDAGRAYRFRYLLDGQRWDNDWAADAYLPNDFGGDDSVVDLTALAEAVPRAAKKAPAKKDAVKKAAPAQTAGKAAAPAAKPSGRKALALASGDLMGLPVDTSHRLAESRRPATKQDSCVFRGCPLFHRHARPQLCSG